MSISFLSNAWGDVGSALFDVPDIELQRLKGWGLSLVGHGRRACVTDAGCGFRPMS
jgi:hypothetical protein